MMCQKINKTSPYNIGALFISSRHQIHVDIFSFDKSKY